MTISIPEHLKNGCRLPKDEHGGIDWTVEVVLQDGGVKEKRLWPLTGPSDWAVGSRLRTEAQELCEQGDYHHGFDKLVEATGYGDAKAANLLGTYYYANEWSHFSAISYLRFASGRGCAEASINLGLL